MKIISFAWTTPVLLAGAKTVTRRSWSDSYARTFHCGDSVAAYDKLPRAGGHKVAVVELTSEPYKEAIGLAPSDDFQGEGLRWMQEHGQTIQGLSPIEFWKEWQQSNELVWVVRFRLIEVIEWHV